MIKAPLSLNLYVSYLHTTHIQTTSFARPLARQCVLVVVGTTEWECGETFRANNRLVVQSRRFYVIIFVPIDMHFPSFGIRYQCERPRWRIALFQFSLIFTICAVGSSIGQAIFFVSSRNQQQFANGHRKKSKSKSNQLVSILFLSKSWEKKTTEVGQIERILCRTKPTDGQENTWFVESKYRCFPFAFTFDRFFDFCSLKCLKEATFKRSSSQKHMCGLHFRTRNSPSQKTSLRWGDSCFNKQ